MNSKDERISKIKTFLRMQSASVTVTEIHEALTKRMGLRVSRKTIERDMAELVDRSNVAFIHGVPAKFVLNKTDEITIRLKPEELKYILDRLEPDSELFLRLALQS